MSILYIDPLTPEINFLIFEGDTVISKTLPKNMETASTFPKMLIDIVDTYKITEIWCITGPGPFTLMRVITLAINAIMYTRSIRIKSAHFFDLIESTKDAILEANAREYIIRQDGMIYMLDKEMLSPGVYEGILSEVLSTEDTKFIQYKEDMDAIKSIFSNKAPEMRISPIYLKPPHITGQKPSAPHLR